MSSLSYRIAKNSLTIYVGKIISLTISFFIFVYLANYLGEISFGQLSLAIAYIGTFEILVNFGLNQILVREISIHKSSTAQLLGNGIILKFILAFLAIIISNLLSVFLYPSRDVLILIWIISLNLFFSTKLSSARTVFDTIFQVDLQMFFPIIFGVIDALLFALLLYFFTLWNKIGLIGIAIIYTVSNLPGTVLLLLKFFKTTTPKFKINLYSIRSLLLESLPIAIYLFFSILNTKFDILLLSWMRSDAEIGFYSAAIRLVYPLVFFSTSFSISLFPLLSKYYSSDQQQFTRVLKFGAKFIFVIALFLALALFFNANEIITKFYISSYRPAILPFKYLILAMGINFLNLYLVDILVATKKQIYATIVLGISLLVNVLLNLILIPKFGIVGASYVRLTTSLLVFILLFFFLSNKLKISKIFPYTKLGLLSCLFLIFSALLDKFGLILNLLISLLTFTSLLFALKIFSKKELNLLFSFLKLK